MSVASPEPDFKRLPLAAIDPPELAIRSRMDPDALDELVKDVQVRGVRLPLEVVPRGARYEIIAGHRRYTAAERAGLVAVPCFIYRDRDDYIESDRYLENALQERMNPADEAVYLARLLETKCGGDTDRLAAYVRKSRVYVEARVLLFQGDERVFAALKAGAIGVGIATELNRCTEERWRRYLLQLAIDDGATQAVVAGWVLDWKRKTDALNRPLISPEVAAAETAEVTVPQPTCCVCGKSDRPLAIEQIFIHTHCHLAILEPLLAAYHGDEPAGR